MTHSDWLYVLLYSFVTIQAEYIYFILVFLGVCISYLMIKPIMSWCVMLRFILFLGYLTSSLFVVAIFFTVVLFLGDLSDSLLNLLKITLQCLAIWGGIMILYHSLQRVLKRNN